MLVDVEESTDVEDLMDAKDLHPAATNAAPTMRRPGSRQLLGDEFIIAAALDIIDTQGTEALTMRALALQLQSGTATLYRHFSNRAAVIAAVVDHMLSKLDFGAPDVDSGPWQQACKNMAQQMFDAFAAHPNLAPLIPDISERAGAVMREKFFAILLRDGIPPAEARRFYVAVGRHVVGFISQLRAHPGAGERGAASRTSLSDVDGVSYPVTASVAAGGVSGATTVAEEFSYGLELIFIGFEHTLSR